MSESEQLDLAKSAYFNYGTVTDHKNFRGDPMPAWDALPATIQRAWIRTSIETYHTALGQIRRKIGLLIAESSPLEMSRDV